MNEIGFLVLDVDDVVVVMKPAELAAEASVLEPLEQELGTETASLVHSAFVSAYQILRDQLWAAPGVKLPTWIELRARIDHWQRGLTEAGHEVKQWSRDTLLAIALEDAGVKPTSRLVSCAVDRYWKVLGDQSHVYPDALELFAALRENQIPFHLATNSDGFLHLEDARQTFVYDPADARARKLARLHVLGAAGIGPEDVSIGDPIGKPSPRFFEKVMAEFGEKLRMSIDRRRVLAVGDSVSNDVLPPMQIGVGHGAWIDRHSTGTQAPPPVRTIHLLTDLLPLP